MFTVAVCFKTLLDLLEYFFGNNSRNGIYEAFVLLFKRFHLFVEFGLLFSPIPAEAFKEAYFNSLTLERVSFISFPPCIPDCFRIP